MPFTIQFDYRFDSNNFFSDPARRAALEAAADVWENVIADDFADLPVGLEFDIDNPNTGATESITLTSAVDDIIVFVGATTLAGSALGRAGPTGYSADGDIYRLRVSDNFRGQGPTTDFEPWAGTIVFDTAGNWSFDLAGPVAGKNDFISVAVHEIGHILGFGTSGAFDALISGDDFVGVNAMAANGGNPVPLHDDDAHVEEGFDGDTVSLDPALTTGTRVLLSDIDKAMLADIGYQITGFTAQGSQPALATSGGETIFGSILDDVIDGLGGGDQIQGDRGNDLILGGAGNDILFGQEDDDTLDGGADDDQLQGGSGNDLMRGGSGDDTFFGQSGVDTFLIAAGDEENTIIDFDLSNEIIRLQDSGFGSIGAVLASITKPFSNVSRVNLPDGTTVDVFHGSQGGTPLNAGHFELTSSGGGGNNAPTGSVTVSGTVAEGSVLTAQTGGLSDADGLGSFSYRWLRDGADISGATGVQYTLTQQDVGAQMSVRVSYTDGLGTPEAVTSAATAAVTNVNDAPTGLPGISGTLSEGSPLTAQTGSIGDEDGLGVFGFQWRRDGIDIGGATGVQYVLVQQDVGAQISVEVSYVDGQGTPETLVSAATSAIQNVNAPPTGFPTISGTAEEGQTLTVVTSGIADADGLGAFSYDWLRNGVSTGESGTSYLLDAADIGASISVEVRFTDGQGTPEVVASAGTQAVLNVNAPPTGSVTVAGTALQGQVLTANTTFLQDEDGLGTFGYQWLRDGADVSGGTGSTYALTQQDVGAQISVEVFYVDAQGTFEQVTSGETVAVGNVNDLPTGQPFISGVRQQGQTLTANTVDLSDADGLGTLSYAWLRDGVATGQSGATYQLTQADVGAVIRFVVSYTDGGGTAEAVDSVSTDPIANLNDAPSGQPVITGTATQGEMLSVDVSSIMDADVLGPFAYQWVRDGVDIPGATGTTYTLTQADVGAAINLVISYTDGQGTYEELEGTATAPIANVNDDPTGLPVITGTVQEGSQLLADISGVSDADGMPTPDYQWLRDGVAIGGAFGNGYVLTQDDVGAEIRVQISFTDFGGTAETVISAPTVPVENLNDSPTGTLSLSGIAAIGQTLISDTSHIQDADGLGPFSYSWLRNASTIPGATDETYTLTSDDIGSVIRVSVTYTDGFGTVESLTSAATGSVQNADQMLSGDDGDNRVEGGPGDDILTGGMGEDTLVGGDGADVFVINPGDETVTLEDFDPDEDRINLTGFDRAVALAAFYALDEDLTLTFEDGTVLILQGDGLALSDVMLSDFAFATGNLAPTGDVVVSGLPFVGKTLTGDVSAVDDGDGINSATITLQWLRDGVPISGATGTSYLLHEDDVGTALSLQYGFEDAFGVAESVTSAATLPISFEALSLMGNGMDNVLIGDGGDDTITAGDGQDRLTGAGGDDDLNGGAGRDTATYSGDQRSYTVTLSPDGVQVTDRRADGDGTDQLVDVEVLDFATELSVFGDAVDLTRFGGPAALTAEELETVIEFYIAYFNRAPDAIGLFFWATAFADGTTLDEMAALFIDQAETLAAYPPGTSNEVFAETVYDNVLGRVPDLAGFNFWVGVLDSGAVSRGTFILEVLRGAKAAPPDGATPEFIAQQQADQAYLETKTDIGAYFAVHRGMSDTGNAAAAMALFDGTQTGVQAATAAVDGFYADALDAIDGAFLMPLVGVLDDPFMI